MRNIDLLQVNSTCRCCQLLRLPSSQNNTTQQHYKLHGSTIKPLPPAASASPHDLALQRLLLGLLLLHAAMPSFSKKILSSFLTKQMQMLLAAASCCQPNRTTLRKLHILSTQSSPFRRLSLTA